MTKRLVGDEVTELEVTRPIKINGTLHAVGEHLTLAVLKVIGRRLDLLISRGYFKVPGQLPLRSNRSFRSFHITPRDWKKAGV